MRFSTGTAVYVTGVSLSFATAFKTVSDSHCDCYVTDGCSPTYYSSHGFWDFRNLHDYADVPDNIKTIEGNNEAGLSSKYFEKGKTHFRSFWHPVKSAFDRDGFGIIRTLNNVFIALGPHSDGNSFLALRTTREQEFQTCAEISSNEKVHFASVRTLARAVGNPGACMSLFTYLEGDGDLMDIQESDIEILTKDPEGRIHYTNQPSYRSDDSIIKGATHNDTMADGALWSDWHVHRFDWMPELTAWYLNGKEMRKQEFNTPKDPSYLVFSAFSSGMGWSGKMDMGGAAYLEIQWIEILHDIVKKKDCDKLCSIDKSKVRGQPVLLKGKGQHD